MSRPYVHRDKRLFPTLVLGAAIAASAAAAPQTQTQTILVPPGAEAAIIVPSTRGAIIDVYGGHRGTLLIDTKGIRYEPEDAFWDAGNDLLLVAIDQGTTVLVERYRLVAADSAGDHGGAVLGDLTGLPSNWVNWELVDPQQLAVPVTGALGGIAYFLPATGTPLDQPKLVVPIEDTQSGNNGTASSGTVHVTVRDIGTIGPPLNQNGDRFTFFSISEGTTEIVRVEAVWLSGAWKMQAIGPSISSTLLDLAGGLNRVRLQRWTNAEGGSGTDLFLEDRRIITLDTSPHDPESAETFVISAAEYVGNGQVELRVEAPRAQRGEQWIDPTTTVVADGIDGGVDAAWTVINGFAQSLSAQDLPGPGDRLDIDLGLLPQGHSSFLERPVTLPPGGVLDPAGYAIRFWVDPTAASFAVDTAVRIATACTETGSCGAARVWIGRDSQGLTLTATAQRELGPGARVETAVTNEPHLVELRMRHGIAPGIANGWLELWVDGRLHGRVDGIDNHTKQIAKLRLGALNDAAGSSGIIGLDDYEMWRFE